MKSAASTRSTLSAFGSRFGSPILRCDDWVTPRISAACNNAAHIRPIQNVRSCVRALTCCHHPSRLLQTARAIARNAAILRVPSQNGLAAKLFTELPRSVAQDLEASKLGSHVRRPCTSILQIVRPGHTQEPLANSCFAHQSPAHTANGLLMNLSHRFSLATLPPITFARSRSCPEQGEPPRFALPYCGGTPTRRRDQPSWRSDKQKIWR